MMIEDSDGGGNGGGGGNGDSGGHKGKGFANLITCSKWFKKAESSTLSKENGSLKKSFPKSAAMASPAKKSMSSRGPSSALSSSLSSSASSAPPLSKLQPKIDDGLYSRQLSMLNLPPPPPPPRYTHHTRKHT